MSKYLGDYAKPTGAGTLEFKFSTFRPSTGAAFSLSSGAAVTIYKGGTGNTTGQSTTLTRDWNSITGLNHVSVDLSQAFFVDGEVYEAVITTGTIDSVSVIGACVGRFTLRAQASLYPTDAGRTLDVSTTGEAGIDLANVGSPSATLSLSGTTIKAVTDNVGVGSIANDAITASAIASNAITSAKIATNAIGATQIAGNAITSDKIAGNAIGSAQIADNAITADKIATNAIGADEISAGAVTKIQTGLSTLTSANVSSAVWSVPVASYTTADTFGERIIITDGNNGNQVKVTPPGHIAADVHEFQAGTIEDTDFATGSVNDRLDTMLVADGAVYQYTANALELAPSGGGGGATTYVTGNLPYQIRSDQQFPQGTIELIVGSLLRLDLQVLDADGIPINLTGATVTVGLRNASTNATVGTDQSATLSFARMGFVYVDTVAAWTATAGTYRLTVSATMGADVIVAGPMPFIVKLR